LVYEGTDDKPGFWREYEGGVQDWLTQSERARGLAPQVKAASAPAAAKTTADTTKAVAQPSVKTRKLSYKEQRELDALPTLIASLEAEQKETQAALNDSGLYASDPAKIAQLHKRDNEIEEALMTALERWEQLSTPA
jgi:ATP-binding cassette subfamily F protein uup